jgi:hypothetical protein
MRYQGWRKKRSSVEIVMSGPKDVIKSRFLEEAFSSQRSGIINPVEVKGFSES